MEPVGDFDDCSAPHLTSICDLFCERVTTFVSGVETPCRAV
jgi:hypothetical protein